MSHDRVAALVAKRLQIPALKVTPASVLTRDLGADSLEVVECVMDVEAEFKVEIPDDKFDMNTTVADLVAFASGAGNGTRNAGVGVPLGG